MALINISLASRGLGADECLTVRRESRLSPPIVQSRPSTPRATPHSVR